MKLYVVPTPIGNLEDMTFRAVKVLNSVDLGVRRIIKKNNFLLKHYGIKTPMQSHQKFNEHKTLEHLVEKIKSGQNVALISDAGTPAISDPGFMLVRACVEQEIEVECLPGATAFVPALVTSGLPNDRFCFEGFLPQKKGRQTKLKSLAAESRTMIFYESPFRIVKTLTQLAEVLGTERRASVSREISKLYEETVRGTLTELAEHFTLHPPKGEFVLIVAGYEE